MNFLKEEQRNRAGRLGYKSLVTALGAGGEWNRPTTLFRWRSSRGCCGGPPRKRVLLAMDVWPALAGPGPTRQSKGGSSEDTSWAAGSGEERTRQRCHTAHRRHRREFAKTARGRGTPGHETPHTRPLAWQELVQPVLTSRPHGERRR